MPVPGGTTEKFCERGLAPFEEPVALAVALVFQLDVPVEGPRRAELVDDHRMVDHEVDRHQRVDPARIAAERLCMASRMAARSTTAGHAREVLHQDAGRAIGDLLLDLAAVVEPAGDRLDVGLGDRAAVLVAQQVLEQDLHREGQPGDAGEAVLLGLRQGVIGVGLVADRERLARVEARGDCVTDSILTSGFKRTVCSAECAN